MTGIKAIAQVPLFDRYGRLLIYRRDNKPGSPFPDHWDFFGGHLESEETPDQALVREVEEELGLALKAWKFFRTTSARKAMPTRTSSISTGRGSIERWMN